jgi:hypothetical protein
MDFKKRCLASRLVSAPSPVAGSTLRAGVPSLGQAAGSLPFPLLAAAGTVRRPSCVRTLHDDAAPSAAPSSSGLSATEQHLLKSGATAVTNTTTLHELMLGNDDLQEQMVQAYR